MVPVIAAVRSVGVAGCGLIGLGIGMGVYWAAGTGTLTFLKRSTEGYDDQNGASGLLRLAGRIAIGATSIGVVVLIIGVLA